MRFKACLPGVSGILTVDADEYLSLAQIIHVAPSLSSLRTPAGDVSAIDRLTGKAVSMSAPITQFTPGFQVQFRVSKAQKQGGVSTLKVSFGVPGRAIPAKVVKVPVAETVASLLSHCYPDLQGENLLFRVQGVSVPCPQFGSRTLASCGITSGGRVRVEFTINTTPAVSHSQTSLPQKMATFIPPTKKPTAAEYAAVRHAGPHPAKTVSPPESEGEREGETGAKRTQTVPMGDRQVMGPGGSVKQPPVGVSEPHGERKGERETEGDLGMEHHRVVTQGWADRGQGPDVASLIARVKVSERAKNPSHADMDMGEGEREREAVRPVRRGDPFAGMTGRSLNAEATKKVVETLAPSHVHGLGHGDPADPFKMTRDDWEVIQASKRKARELAEKRPYMTRTLAKQEQDQAMHASHPLSLCVALSPEHRITLLIHPSQPCAALHVALAKVFQRLFDTPCSEVDSFVVGCPPQILEIPLNRQTLWETGLHSNATLRLRFKENDTQTQARLVQ
ncbi:hypothetical protein KIPB_009000, partial [Kipferlia bialata]|eukprot:g9000.t1